MQMITVLPAVAGLVFILFALYTVYRNETSQKHAWLFPAALSLLFLLFSLQTIFVEGTVGFWTEHTSNLWGNQIWFDLLLAGGIGLFFAVPQAKRLEMQPLPWVILVVCTGSIGLLAMVARILYLRDRSKAAA